MRATVLAVLGAAIVLLVVAQQLIRAQTGPLPLVSVFELHLLLVAGVLAVGALIGSLGTGRAGAWVRLASLVVILVVLVRAGGELWSPDPSPAVGDQLTVLSWNLEADSRDAAAAVEGVLEIEADVVALQELTTEFGAAIEADADIRARYPYRILDARAGTTGLGLLSKLPLVVRADDPSDGILPAGLLLSDGRTIQVLDVHPTRPLYRTIGPLPVALDTRARDEDVLVVRAAVDAFAERASALVIGDLNGTSSEPGLEPLEAVLADAHEAAGTGPGFTWRPELGETFGIGVLRIDHVMTGGWLRPIDTSTDCEPTGDHCRLLVRLAIEPPGT
jgi:vancomycin resistance protein VanJ